jgi:hypothetical protein
MWTWLLWSQTLGKWFAGQPPLILRPIMTHPRAVSPTRVGIIGGCGAIIFQYPTMFRRLDSIDLVTVADLD